MEESITEEDKNKLTKAAFQSLCLSSELVRKAELLHEQLSKSWPPSYKWICQCYNDKAEEICMRHEETSEYIHQILKKYFPRQTRIKSALWEVDEIRRIKRETSIKRTQSNINQTD